MDNNERKILIFFTALLVLGAFILGREKAVISHDIHIGKSSLGKVHTLEEIDREIIEARRININTATIEDLQKIPGVGEVTAEAIIRNRDEVGSYISIDDLLKVKGIGEKTIKKIGPWIKLR